MAEVFASMNDERVILVKELGIVWKRCFEQRAELFVRLLLGSEAVTFENAAGVRVNHKHWMVTRIKKDGVGGFRADTVNGEQLFAKDGSWSPKHSREGTAVLGK